MITSAQNIKIQKVRALINQKSERQKAGKFIIEGVRLCEECLQSSWLPEFVLFTDQLSNRGRIVLDRFAILGIQIEEISVSLMDSTAGTENPQGILAVLKIQHVQVPQSTSFVLILDNIRDPGNLGTLLRSATAAGVDLVFLTPGTTDVYSPKVLRAGMGAHFKIPLLIKNWEDIALHCGTVFNQSLRVFLASGVSGSTYWNADFRLPLALIIGGEADGATPQAHLVADEVITIPMPGGMESLNAAVAGSVILFEIARQRNQA